jgi:hypothetical protein
VSDLLNPAVIGAATAGVAAILTATPSVIRAIRETPNGHEHPRRLLDRLVNAIRHTTVWRDLDQELRSDIDRELDQ